MAINIQEYDDIEEYEDAAPVVKPPVSDEELERRAARKAALEQPELESHGGLDFLGALGSGIERSQMLPGKLLWGALDLAQGLPVSKAGNYLTDTLAPKPIGDLARRVRETPKEWLDYYENRSAQLAKEDEALNPSLLNRLASGTTQAAFELPVQLLGGVVGAGRQAALKGVATGQGIISGLGKYAQERGEGADRLTAASRGGASGLITGLTTRAFGDTGIESIFRKEGIRGIQNRLVQAAKDAGMEGAEEGLDSLQQDFLDRITKNPNRSLGDTLTDVLMSGAIGAFLGAGVSGAKHVKKRITDALESETTPAVRDVRETTVESEPEVPSTGSSEETDVGGGEATATEGKIVPTPEEIIARPRGETTSEEIMALSDDDAARLFTSLKEGGERNYEPQYDAVFYGIRMGESAIPKLEKLAKSTAEEQRAAWEQSAAAHKNNAPPEVIERINREISSKASKHMWMNAALEGAKGKGGNYDTAITVAKKRGELPAYVKTKSNPITDLKEKISGNSVLTTEDATRAGLSATSLNDLESLMTHLIRAKAYNQNLDKRIANGEKPTVEEIKTRSRNRLKVFQIIREAIETATNTGSNTHADRLAYNKDAEKAPLDWKTNPEVEAWLRKNGKEVGIEIPEAAAAESSPATNVESPQIGETTSNRQSIIDKADARLAEIQARLRGGKNSFTGITGLEPMIADGAITAARAALKVSGKIADAIQAAIAWIRKNHPGVTFNDGTFTSELSSLLGEGNGPEPELEVESFTPVDPQSGSPLPPTPPPTPTLAGPGPAVIGDTSPQGTSLKNAVGEVERAGHGLPEATPTQRREMGEAWLESGRVVESDATAGERLADELLKNPDRGMSDEDSALLLRHKTALINAKNQAAEDGMRAKDPEARRDAQKRFEAASNELLDILNAAKERGASWGREGRWRQALAFEDFSLETMRRDKQMSLDRPLTPAENEEVTQLHNRIAELEKQLAEARTITDNKERIAAGDEAVKDAVERARSERRKDEASGVVRNLEQERQAAIQRLKERFNEQGDLAGSNREMDKLMELFARNGIDERVAMEDAVHNVLVTMVDPEITRQDTQDLMSGYGKFTPLSKDPIKAIVRGIKGEIQQVRKLLDFWQNIYPKQTGKERRVPTDKERAWIKLVNQAKKAFKILPPDQASRVKSAIETVNTRLKNRIADLKTEIATRKKIVRERTPSPYDEETLRLKKEVEALQKEHDEIFGRSELTMEQRLKISKAAADRQIKELERQLKTGEVFNRNKTQDAPTDDELEALRSRIEALKYERDNVRETLQPTMEPEAKTLLDILQRYSRLAEKYEERLAKKDFAKKERKAPPVSEDTARAKARLDKAKEDFRNGLEKDRYDRSSVWKKVATQAGNVWDTSRLFMTGGELSFLLRQGKAGLLTRPGAWAKAVPPSMKALLSTPEGAATLNNQILESSDAKEAQAHGLYLSQMGARPSAREEIAFGRMAEHLPFIRNFNQAGLVFLNKLRLDHYKALTKSLTQTGTPTAEEAQNIAEMVNIFSGRGGLGAAARIPTIMNRTFFSPRYLTSRFQMASGYPIWGGGRTMRSRKLMAKEYARLLIGYGLYYSILAGGLAGLTKFGTDDEDEVKVGTDWRSSDFGKVIVGETRVDPLAGLGQVGTLAGRGVSGETVTAAGKVEDIRTDKPKFGGKKWSDIAFRFARTKANPVPGNFINWMDGTDLMGNPVSVKQMAADFFVPMTYGDIYDALKENDIPSGTAIALLGFLGEGIQTYNQGKNTPAPATNAIIEYPEE